jgi:hypothetical protein
MSRRRSGNPARRGWHPMERGTVNPALVAELAKNGMSADGLEAWGNHLYQCVVRNHADRTMHLSIKRHDRAAVRDWRHLQAIKNDIAGPEREGCELFPAESRLTDSANEYHIWVLPEGERLPFGWEGRFIMTAEENAAYNAERGGKGKQRAWEEGLTTGH